jgi:hypothetical protein
MGRKPKAGSVKGKTTDPEQSARFIEAARLAGVDESGEAFEEAFRRITGAPPPRGFAGTETARPPRRRRGGKPA